MIFFLLAMRARFIAALYDVLYTLEPGCHWDCVSSNDLYDSICR